MPQAREFDAKKAERLRRAARHYTPDLLGAPCPLCRNAIPTALIAAGIGVHPTCHPDDRDLLDREAQRA